MKVCDKSCIFCFFPISNKYLGMAKRSLLSRCPSYIFTLIIIFFKIYDTFEGVRLAALFTSCLVKNCKAFDRISGFKRAGAITNLSSLGYGQVAGSCGRANKPSGNFLSS